MGNPFEDENAIFFALTGDDGKYSLWPGSIPLPDGWAVQCGPMSRAACLAQIETNWTDIRQDHSQLGDVEADGHEKA